MDYLRELNAIGTTPTGEVDAMDFWLPVVVVFAGNLLFGVFC